MFGYFLDTERVFGRVGGVVRTRVRWARVAALGLAALALMGVAGRAAASGGSAAAHEKTSAYVVRSGDTLWQIATHILGPTAHPRPLVDAIGSLNGTTGALVPGQILRIPRST